MNLLPDGSAVALLAALPCGAMLLMLWASSHRSRRHAGFASKTHLKRELSAKAVLRASEIRPSLTSERPTKPVNIPKLSLSRRS